MNVDAITENLDGYCSAATLN